MVTFASPTLAVAPSLSHVRASGAPCNSIRAEQHTSAGASSSSIPLIKCSRMRAVCFAGMGFCNVPTSSVGIAPVGIALGSPALLTP